MDRTVIVVHPDPACIEPLLLRLADRGWHVLGPVRSTAHALALASQSPTILALIGARLASEDDGRLPRSLRDLWGVPSLIIPEEAATPST